MKNFIKNNWILLLVIAQPILDVIAFFTASESGTVSGYIRLAVMLALTLYAFINNYRKKEFIISAILIAAVFALHILNGLRVGYKDFRSDLMYSVKVAYMPVMALVFCTFANSGNIKNQLFKGIIINAFITAAVILLSYITGTYTDTYGPGWGISGWVISDNRCCHSDILSSCCVFLGYLAVRENMKPWVKVSVSLLIFALLLTNGTQACFYSLFGIFVGYPVFLILRRFIANKSFSKFTAVTMFALALVAVVIYPYTPRYKMEMYERSFFSDVQIKFVEKMNNMGYDVENMSPQERMSTPEVHEALKEYYIHFLYSGMPDETVESFDIDRIIWKYNATIEAGKIGDNRDMKEVFASLMFEDCDFLTRCFGFEFATIGQDLTADLENDWYAILYYYGYFGFAAYIFAVLYILRRIVKLLLADFKNSITDENFCLLMCFVLQLGLAFFSGAILRRPNASIYMSLVCALIYFSTKQGRYET